MFARVVYYCGFFFIYACMCMCMSCENDDKLHGLAKICIIIYLGCLLIRADCEFSI